MLLISHFTFKVSQSGRDRGRDGGIGRERLRLARVLRAAGNVDGFAPLMDPIIVSSRLSNMMPRTRLRARYINHTW